MILAGDIGGTNTRLAFFEGTPDHLNAVAIEVFPSQDHKGLAEIARIFLDKHHQTARAAVFGIAGAVVDGRVEATNLPWVVDARSLASELGIDRVALINDLLANAHGIALLDESDFVALNPGSPSPTGKSRADLRGNRIG